MSTLPEILSEFKYIASNPKARFKAYLEQGKKVIGCMPYFCPEELIFAAGMIPMGLWGAETRVMDARRYFPAFICSLLQTTLELGIRGEYDGLSAVMIPMLCDSLKSVDGNWRAAVKNVPVIPVAHAQNRKIPAGAEFTASQYRKIRTRLEELSGKTVTDDDIRASIAIYNGRNAAVRRFIDELAKRPGIIKASERNAVFKSGYFIAPDEFTRRIEELTSRLAEELPEKSGGPRIVTCGIIADNTGLLEILDGCGICISGDVVVHESVRYLCDTSPSGDPIMSLALMMGAAEGCPALYDPEKKRAEMIVDTVKRSGADGVLFVITKFCDPDEYDVVPIKRILDKNGIWSLQVEIDQQTTDIEQIRTAIETFCEIMGYSGGARNT